MITTTTHTIEGRHITAYLDIVSAESVQGVNLVRDLFAGMRDIFGGRSQTLERALQEARSQATDEIRERARALQADAVWGSIIRSACHQERAAWWWFLYPERQSD
jgi:uncharacterized protein YbjQ (UPF0145 family)